MLKLYKRIKSSSFIKSNEENASDIKVKFKFFIKFEEGKILDSFSIKSR